MTKGRYIIEFVRVGKQVKVTACDTETGIEAVIIGPSNLPQHALRDQALKKLHYVMGKQGHPAAGPDEA